MNDKQKNIFVIGGILLSISLIISLVCIVLNYNPNTRNNNEDALRFKTEYEVLNNTVDLDGNTLNKVLIKEDNPIVYSSLDEIITKIDNKESFIVYFGYPSSFYCRNIIEYAINAANAENINTIYYINLRNENDEEIIRDEYNLNKKNKIELKREGTKEYKELLSRLGNILDDYILINKDEEELKVGEKRLLESSFIYIKNGVPIKLENGYITKNKEQEIVFKNFFDITR